MEGFSKHVLLDGAHSGISQVGDKTLQIKSFTGQKHFQVMGISIPGLKETGFSEIGLLMPA